MEKKKIIILAGIFLALLVVVLMLEKPYQTKVERPDKYLVAIDSQKVSTITVKKKEEETILSKKGDQWVVENKDNFPADPDVVADILKLLDGLETVQLVSKNPEKVNIFEVDTVSGIEVKAEGKGTNAHFYVGKNGQDYNSNYIRREGSDEVYLSSDFIRRFFDRPDFRSRKIFDLKDREITRLVYKFPDREIELVRDADKNWKQIKDKPYNAKKDAVESLITGLENLKIDEFVDKPEEKKFDNPQFELSFNCQDGYENTLVAAQKGKDDNRIFIKSALKPYQYKVYEHQINRLTDKLKDLKEPPPPPPTEEKTDSKKEQKGSQPSDKS
jgi:hypothetical protein